MPGMQLPQFDITAVVWRILMIGAFLSLLILPFTVRFLFAGIVYLLRLFVRK